MTTVVECIEGHYEVHKVSYGEAYVWCPECVVVECDCGERPILTTSETVCECGADHAALIREELASRKVPDGAPHPWEVEYQGWPRKDEHLLSEETHGHAGWFSEEPTLLQRYLIIGHGSKGLELPHIFSDSGEEVLPVFSSEEAARRFLALSSLGKGWCVRGFSCGELVSVIFAFHTGLNGLLLDPPPGALSEDVRVSLVGRDAFVSSLLET
jgi:hypothetical protein